MDMSDLSGSAKVFDNETASKLDIDDYTKNVKIPVETQCPDCGTKLVPESGCLFCPVCGWSQCK
jgi:Zn finger protein HypA/HybF involved in hydrogenase expression